MAMQTVTIELPEEIVSLLGTADSAPETARKLIVFDLLRQGKIGQGQAARLLGVSRYELLDMMAERQIPSAPRTIQDARAEIKTIEKLSQR